MSFLDDFFIRAVLAGIGVGLAAAPLGCFVVWRKMAYFGDATAHAAILGVAFSLAFEFHIFGGALVISLIMALLVSSLSEKGYSSDTLLGVMAHSTLAFGLVWVSLLSHVRVDLMSYLFGDILAVTRFDLMVVWLCAASCLSLLWWRWSSLLTVTVNSDLAYASGISPKREQLILSLALALVVAMAIKVVGVLLITSMLIIPASAARPLSNTPEKMAILAIVISALSVVLGLHFSYLFDTPSGPTIVCVATMFFLASAMYGALRRL